MNASLTGAMLRPTSIPSDDNVRESFGNTTVPTSRAHRCAEWRDRRCLRVRPHSEHTATLRDQLLRHNRRVRMEIVVVEAEPTTLYEQRVTAVARAAIDEHALVAVDRRAPLPQWRTPAARAADTPRSAGVRSAGDRRSAGVRQASHEPPAATGCEWAGRRGAARRSDRLRSTIARSTRPASPVSKSRSLFSLKSEPMSYSSHTSSSKLVPVACHVTAFQPSW